jgi:hypothetical protein
MARHPRCGMRRGRWRQMARMASRRQRPARARAAARRPARRPVGMGAAAAAAGRRRAAPRRPSHCAVRPAGRINRREKPGRRAARPGENPAAQHGTPGRDPIGPGGAWPVVPRPSRRLRWDSDTDSDNGSDTDSDSAPPPPRDKRPTQRCVGLEPKSTRGTTADSAMRSPITQLAWISL